MASATYNAPSLPAAVTGWGRSSLRGVMKGFGAALSLGLACLVLAGCGGDSTTTFVLESGSPTATAQTGTLPPTPTTPHRSDRPPRQLHATRHCHHAHP